MVLYLKGGAYFDHDTVSVRPLPDGTVPNFGYITLRKKWNNAIVKFQAGHPLLEHVIDKMVR